MASATLSNNVLELSVSAARGNSLASFKVLGVETLDTHDLGRGVQVSLYFPTSPPVPEICKGVDKHWLNLQSAGNDQGVAARVYHGPDHSGRSITVGAYPQLSPYGGELWENSADNFKIAAEYTLGPLEEAPFAEVARLKYRFYSTRSLEFTHRVCDQRNAPTIVPFIPLAFFKSEVLDRLFGLDPLSEEWREYTPQADTVYHPSQYRQQVMAWMRPDLGWGVALYGGWTLSESEQPNFAAQKFPPYGINYLALVDQSLTILSTGQDEAAAQRLEREAYLVAGNLATIQAILAVIRRRKA